MVVDTVGAFVPGPSVMASGASDDGPLAGLTFGAKDVFDVAGHRTGGGNPDWLADAPPASRNAAAVQALLDGGATLVGKTQTDELAYSMAGTNVHYGTPANTNAPGRIPGGSSSGSAAAVAAGLVDLALGTDTGGSIRVPASYCGIVGWRPSWGRVPVDGVMPLSQTYDTAGLVASDPRRLRAAATVLLGGRDRTTTRPAEAVVLADDAWAIADPDTARVLLDCLGHLRVPLEHVDLSGSTGGLGAWTRAFQTIQGAEAWAAYGGWISSRHPTFGPGIAARFDAASRVTSSQLAEARSQRDLASDRLRAVLGGGRRVLVIPSAPGPAPELDATSAERADVRQRALRLTCIAGHAGAPVVSIPIANVGGLPVGLSLMGLPGRDEQVLDLALAAWEAIHP